jgi:hypothetical protein
MLHLITYTIFIINSKARHHFHLAITKVALTSNSFSLRVRYHDQVQTVRSLPSSKKQLSRPTLSAPHTPFKSSRKRIRTINP